MTFAWWRRRHGRGGVAAALVLLAGLGGCSTFSFDSLNPFASAEEKLPGERVAVITETDPLTVDPEAAQNVPPLPQAQSNTDWSQPGGVASNAPGNLALSGTPSRAWSISAARGSSSGTRLSVTPIIYQDRVFVMDTAAQVSAFTTGGSRSWAVDLRPKREDDDGVIGGGLAADGGRILAATGYGSVAALDPASGQVLWRQELKIPVRSAPTAAGGFVYVVTSDNKIHALSVADGTSAWTYRGIPETTGLLANASPAVDGDTVIVPYSSGEIIAFKASSGDPVWSDSLTRAQLLTSVGGINDVAARPVIDRGLVFAVSVSGRMVAVDLKTGERVWTRNVASTQTPIVAGETVYVVTLDGRLTALLRTTGAVRWLTQMPGGRKVRWNGPVLAGGQLWLSSTDEKLVSVDALTGKITGTRDVGEPSYIGPVVAAGRLYLLVDNGALQAFN